MFMSIISSASEINQQVDFSFVNETCKDLYSPDLGRPVKNLPEIMFCSAIVQYMNNYLI
jgi:IS5 family transposase